MGSQNSENWEFSLAEDSIQLSQPSTFKQRLRDEEEPSERPVQPRLETNLLKLPLTSLRALQPDARVLVIIIEAKAMLVGGYQVVFEGSFENTNTSHMVTRFSDI